VKDLLYRFEQIGAKRRSGNNPAANLRLTESRSRPRRNYRLPVLTTAEEEPCHLVGGS
jgi:hypothetical protein